MSTIKVASVQFQHRANDKRYNSDVIDRFTRDAHRAGVKILVFPEMCITGYWHVPDWVWR